MTILLDSLFLSHVDKVLVSCTRTGSRYGIRVQYGHMIGPNGQIMANPRLHLCKYSLGTKTGSSADIFVYIYIPYAFPGC